MIPAIVLAAGKSSRMGRTKALLPAGPSGETFLNRVIRVLREGGADPIVVVIGGDAAAVRASLPRDEASLAVVENPHFEDGQLSSLHVGLAAVEQRYDDIEAAMVTLVDLPLISRPPYARCSTRSVHTHRRPWSGPAATTGTAIR